MEGLRDKQGVREDVFNREKIDWGHITPATAKERPSSEKDEAPSLRLFELRSSSPHIADRLLLLRNLRCFNGQFHF